MVRDFDGKSPKIAPSAFVSEAAYVVGHVAIGENASIWPGAVIRGDFGKITIGKNTSIEDNCVVHGAVEVVIGNDVIVGHAAVIHCRRIGNHVLIGNHATLLDGAEIGDFCLIAAGSVVTPRSKIPAKSLVVGVPARVIGPVTQEKLTRLEKGSGIYVQLARKYKQQGL